MQCMYVAGMRTVQVRNVPEETHSVLRQRAAEAGMSLQEYLLAALKDLAARPTVTEVLARAGGRSGGEVRLGAAAAHLQTDRSGR
jgi:plasmid stability protein